jgi:hypothetical protein
VVGGPGGERGAQRRLVEVRKRQLVGVEVVVLGDPGG